MERVVRDDIGDVLKSIDVNQFSYVIICLNRLDGSCFIKGIKDSESLDDAVQKIRSQGIYGMISVEVISGPDSNLEQNPRKISDEALRYASTMHEGQRRKDGTPYITHPIRVANYVSSYYESKLNKDILIASAYLHDTLEDTSTTYRELLHLFGDQVAGLVLELTSDDDIKEYLGKTKYLEIKMMHMSEFALLIKLCDRLDNVSDLTTSTEKFRNKYVKETLEILDFLLSNRKLSETHISIIKNILNSLVKCRFQCDSVESEVSKLNCKVKQLSLS